MGGLELQRMENGSQTKRLMFTVDAVSAKMKLGEYLFAHLENLSRMYLRELIKTGRCEVNGGFVNSGYRVRANDFIEIEADLSRGTAMRPENVPLEIVFEDADLIVINKPAGMLVHPTHRDKNGTLLNALTFHINREFLTRRRRDAGPKGRGDTEKVDNSTLRTPHSALIRPGLPHRLDKQTSGLMVVAKTARAHRNLSEHFKRKFVKKRYLALVDRLVDADVGSMNAPIGRFAELKYWGVKEDGKPSETRFRVLERFTDTTLLELEPVTGRTNQLRIHCESIGHPIVGDSARGGSEFSRLCLHAYKLSFWHPNGGEWLGFEAEMPAEWQDKY